MAEDNERPCCCSCDCGCKCHDDGIGKTGSTTRILGKFRNSIDLYVSTPPKTKWIFVKDSEKEVAKTLQRTNRELCG